MKTHAARLAQIALLCGLFLGCEWVCARFALPLPGNVLGILVLWILLASGVIRLRWVEQGADWLLSHLSLFFVPAVIAVVPLWPSLRGSLVAIGLVMILSTLLVMLFTGWVAQSLRADRGDEQER